MTEAQIKRKLDLIATHINELAAAIKDQHGRDAIIFFEGEGTIHAMSKDSGGSGASRQSNILASSKYCRFDCGSW